MRVDKFTLALMNRRLVLKTIWERGAINKAEIARRTGLSLPTAIKITEMSCWTTVLYAPVGGRRAPPESAPKCMSLLGTAITASGSTLLQPC